MKIITLDKIWNKNTLHIFNSKMEINKLEERLLEMFHLKDRDKNVKKKKRAGTCGIM